MSRLMKLCSFGVILVISLQNTVLADLQCYSCRGSECSTPSQDHVVTCEADSLAPTTTEAPVDFTTDSDTNFDHVIDVVQVVHVPLLALLEPEEVEDNSNGILIDSSDLPGSDRFMSRHLAQVSQSRNEELLRCVYATYENSGEVSTVRTCALLDENNHQTCMNYVNGELITCYVCDSDLCNSSVKTTFTIFTLVLGVFVAAYF